MTTRQRPAGVTSTGDGEPLPGAVKKKEATTRQRPAGATSTGDGEPLPGAEKKEATTRQRPAGATFKEAASNLDCQSIPI